MGQSRPNVDCSSMWGAPLTIFWSVALLAIFAAAACTGPADRIKAVEPAEMKNAESPDETQLQVPPVRFTDLMPANPQPTDDSLRPGLSVVYYFDYFARHLDPLADIAATPARGRAGKPIPYLNHRFGKGKVFDSGASRGVAMRMKGLLRFPESGEYTFRAISNDGLRIRVADALIIDDPDQHSDRYAVQAIVVIRQKGWYPLAVEYFQRKGTATIALFWRGPSAKAFEQVPASSFAHLP